MLDAMRLSRLAPDVCHRAVDSQDPRFDGVFFVAITTTRVYCRPVCPSRRANPAHRRFFPSAAAAEAAGFRPCLRCRPELAPGRALVDAVSRLAATAAHRIAEGALNGRSVAALARELCVSERHLRRSLEREAGASPLELAQTHRLLLARRLLADTSLNVSRVAFASGFQSLRRFNAVLRERYGMTPTQIRRAARREAADAPAATSRAAGASSNGAAPPGEPEPAPLRLRLAYRPPLAWEHLLRLLARQALPGVEAVARGRYVRTARVEGRSGRISVTHAANDASLVVELSTAFLPVLMPVLARLRRLLDLDAEPAAVDAHLEQAGLRPLVRRRPGLRVPGCFDAFEAALSAIVRDGREFAACERAGFAEHDPPGSAACHRALVQRIVAALGERCAPGAAGLDALDALAPSAARVADAGERRLRELGLPARRAGALARVARAIADGELRLAPGADIAGTHRALAELGVSESAATAITMRVLGWPDAFPACDAALQHAAGAACAKELERRAERWRPWRAYAALHLWAWAEECEARGGRTRAARS